MKGRHVFRSDAQVIDLPVWVLYTPAKMGDKLVIWCAYCGGLRADGVREEVNNVQLDARRLFPGIMHDPSCNAILQDAADAAANP